MRAVLMIANVTKESYQDYHLKAQNDVSEEVHKITLVQGRQDQFLY